MKIKIMTFNTQHCLNYITGKIDFDIMTDTIRKCDADIIGLNEMRDAGSDRENYVAQADIIAKKLGCFHYFAKAIELPEKNPYGNAIISKYPILSAETIMIPDPVVKKYDGYYETRCILNAKIDVCGGLNVFVTHFGLNPDEGQNAVQTVISNVPDKKSILMGDFNLEPESELLIPIREHMYDTAQLFKHELLSFPSDNPERKIDYIFISRDIKVVSADIPAIVASDHRPHTACIEL